MCVQVDGIEGPQIVVCQISNHFLTNTNQKIITNHIGNKSFYKGLSFNSLFFHLIIWHCLIGNLQLHFGVASTNLISALYWKQQPCRPASLYTEFVKSVKSFIVLSEQSLTTWILATNFLKLLNWSTYSQNEGGQFSQILSFSPEIPSKMKIYHEFFPTRFSKVES